jgi:hypothetical protein
MNHVTPQQNLRQTSISPISHLISFVLMMADNLSVSDMKGANHDQG